MICLRCKQEYDETMFPYCPFCLAENSVCFEEKEDESDYATIVVGNPQIGLFEKSVEQYHFFNVLDGEYKKAEPREFEMGELNSSQVEAHEKIEFSNDKELPEEISEASTKATLIMDAFSENTYNMFVSYCNSKGIIYVHELENFDFSLLENLKGFGPVKIKKVKDRFARLQISVEEKTICIPYEQRCFESIAEDILNANIDILHDFGLRRAIISRLKAQGINQIATLKNILKSHLASFLKELELEELLSMESILNKSLKDLFSTVLEHYSNDDKFHAFLCRAEGMTLQDVADIKGVSRERIRQLEQKFYHIVRPYVNCLVDPILKEKNYIPVTEVLDIYDDDNYDRIIVHTLSHKEDLEYLDFADVFVPLVSSKPSQEEAIMKVVRDYVGEGIDLQEEPEKLYDLMQGNGYEFMGPGEITNLLEKYNYKSYGMYIAQSGVSYGKLCAKLVAKEFPIGIKVHDDEAVNRLRRCAYQKYRGINVPENNRSFISRVSEFLVLCDRGTFIAPENIIVDLSVLRQIKEYIDEHDMDSLYYSEIYAQFEGPLTMTSNITNYNFLHGVLKLYFPDAYFYSRDYLSKTEMPGQGIDLGERITNYIMQTRKPVSKNGLRNAFPGISDAMLTSTILEEKQILNWEYDTYTVENLLGFEENEKGLLKEQIDYALEKYDGYCSEQLLYDHVAEKLGGFLVRNDIKSSSNLFYICEHYFGTEYDMRRPHICRKSKFENLSTPNIVLPLIEKNGEIDYTDYMQVATDFKWPHGTMYATFIALEEHYFRISKDKYVNRALINIADEQVDVIDSVIEGKMQHGIMAISAFSEWSLLPDIGFEWNEFLLRSVVETLSKKHRIVSPRVRDRRMEKGIIVEIDSVLCEFTDVVLLLMKIAGIERTPENTLLNYLVMKGIAMKVLPKELYSSPKLKYENGYFISSAK